MSLQTGRWGDLSLRPGLGPILIEHARRGERIQVLLRLLLAVFALITVIAVPPAEQAAACLAIALVYLAWCVAVSVATRAFGDLVVRNTAVVLGVDLVAISAIVLTASASDTRSLTGSVLMAGLFVLPVLAATQLRPILTAAIALPAAIVYLIAGLVASQANAEAVTVVLARTAIISVIGLGCVLLSRLQRSRVVMIADLAAARAELLTELRTIEDRERQALSEHLHDGALQYLLAAKQDLADARDTGDPESFDRVEHALAESSQLLRSTVGALHPAVLEQAGLPRALADAAQAAAARGRFTATVDASGWPDGARTDADGLLFSSARELLANVVKHAGAATVQVRVACDGGWATLAVSDDGRGIDDAAAEKSLSAGHIGLASRRIRVEGAGGTLTIAGNEPRGTRIELRVPAAIL